MLQVYDRVLSSGHLETLWVITGAVVLALLFQALLDALRSRLLYGLSQVFEKNWRTGVFDLLIKDFAWRRQLVSSNPWMMVQTVKQFVASPRMGAVLDLPWVPLYIFVMYLFHPLLGTTALVGSLLLVLFSIWNYRRTKEDTVETLYANQAARDTLDLTLRHSEAILGMGMTEAVRSRWQKQQDAVNEQSNAGHVVTATTSAFTKFFRMFLQVLVLSLGGYLVLRGEISAGAIIANSILLARALAPIELMASGWKSVQESFEALRRLGQLPMEPGAEMGSPMSVSSQPAGALQADNLFFHVGQPPRPVLKGVSFKLAPGDSLAIIGPSGSGKTTLIRLLLGIIEPTGGVCRFDGNEASSYGTGFFKQNVGYLPQKVMLFPGSVAENIARMGEMDAQMVEEAAKLAGCHDMIMQLPEGYGTQVGADGANLSLGQQQRIGLARALYGQPKYVFLDEPNANLDADGDAALLAAMSQCSQLGMTLICIAHRSSVLKHCNKVLLLNQGQVLSFGPRDEVLQKLAGSQSRAVNTMGGL